VVEPNRFASERADDLTMRRAILGGHARRQWMWPHPDDCLDVRRRHRERHKDLWSQRKVIEFKKCCQRQGLSGCWLAGKSLALRRF
jgi:hypothetical protein